MCAKRAQFHARARARLLEFAAAAAAGIAILTSTAAAADDSLTSSADPSVAGRPVTFTASFVPYCADGATVDFTVDGDVTPADSVSVSGSQGTASLTLSTLGAGVHTITFRWSAGVPPDPTCGGGAGLVQTVLDEPSPQPPAASSPGSTPQPPPAATPQAPPSPAPASSSPRLTLTASSSRAYAVLGAAAVVLAVLALVLARRLSSGIARR